MLSIVINDKESAIQWPSSMLKQEGDRMTQSKRITIKKNTTITHNVYVNS